MNMCILYIDMYVHVHMYINTYIHAYIPNSKELDNKIEDICFFNEIFRPDTNDVMMIMTKERKNMMTGSYF
jgi:hypothetical protein